IRGGQESHPRPGRDRPGSGSRRRLEGGIRASLRPPWPQIAQLGAPRLETRRARADTKQGLHAREGPHSRPGRPDSMMEVPANPARTPGPEPAEAQPSQPVAPPAVDPSPASRIPSVTGPVTEARLELQQWLRELNTAGGS